MLRRSRKRKCAVAFKNDRRHRERGSCWRLLDARGSFYFATDFSPATLSAAALSAAAFFFAAFS
jgi:hypothetical protein